MASQWFLGSLKSTTPWRGRRKGRFLLGDPQGVEGEEAGLGTRGYARDRTAAPAGNPTTIVRHTSVVHCILMEIL